MLDSIHIEAYRTLRNTSVSFKDGLNIIIGQNGVGKSNLLGFISNIPMQVMLRRSSSTRFKQLNSNYSYDLKFIDDSNEITHLKFQIETKKPVSIKDEDDKNIEIRFSRIQNDEIFEDALDVTELDAKMRRNLEGLIRLAKPFRGTFVNFAIPQDIPYLSSSKTITLDDSGSLSEYSLYPLTFLTQFEYSLEDNLIDEDFSAVGPEIAKPAIERFFAKSIDELQLNDYLATYTNIKEVRLGRNINVYATDNNLILENLVIEFLIDEVWMPWSYLSDGTKRSFFLIAEVASAKNELVLIEEPEIGLHPFQLHKIMTFIKEQSRTRQIIISTHSPEVLNVLEPNELDQILIASIDKGVTSFRNLTNKQQEKAQTYMNELGDLSNYWLHSDLETND